MTPREDPSSVERECRVATKLAAAWRCDWGRLGQYSPVDVYLMRKSEILAFAEIKTRPVPLPRPTVLLDIHKWFALIQVEVTLAKLAFYVVAFLDGIFFVRIGTLPVHTCALVHTGRTDRQTSADQRPAIAVPTAAFTRLCDSTGIFQSPEVVRPTILSVAGSAWRCPHTPEHTGRNECRIFNEIEVYRKVHE